MCDRDHSAEDQKRYEAGGLITRKQFGNMRAAGVAMLLPGEANAATVTQSDVSTAEDAGRHGGLLLLRSIHLLALAPGVLKVAGYLRAAASIPADG